MNDSLGRRTESANCPDCRSPDFITVHPTWAGSFRISLRNKRRCADCDASYAPPTPIWLPIVAIVASGIALVGSLGAARLIPDFLGPEENLARIGVGGVFLLLAAGALAVLVHASIKYLSWRIAADAPLSPQSRALQQRLHEQLKQSD